MTNDPKSGELIKVVNALPAEMLPPMDFDRLVSTGAFPRINVMQGLSQLVTSRKAQIGDLCIENGANFGTDLKALVCAFRPRAVQLGDAGLEAESFCQKSEVWKRIEAEARSNTKQKGSRPGYGPEFLIWIPPTKCKIARDVPGEKAPKFEDDEFTGFATFHFSKTMRRRSGDVAACMGEPGKNGQRAPGWAYFSTEMVKTSNEWYVANAVKLGDPPKVLPDAKEFAEVLAEFYRPVIEENQAVANQTAGAAGRPR